MKTFYQYQEQFLSIVNKERIPDIGVVGGIEVEHIIKHGEKKSKITTEVGGPGGRVAIYLNDYYGLKPSLFDFLSYDEYIDFIIKTFNVKQIPITWLDKPNGNTRKVRNVSENKEYKDYRNKGIKIEPEFLNEFLYNVSNVFISFASWNSQLLSFINKKSRRTFLDIRDLNLIKDQEIVSDYLFFISDKIDNEIKAQIKQFNGIKILITKDVISYEGRIQEVNSKEKKYFEEAISAYEATFISDIMKNHTLKKALEHSFNIYNYVIEYGTLVNFDTL